MSVLIKICGLTQLEDTLAAIEMGADWLGFNFYPDSPRFLELEEAEKIFQEIPPNIPKVGVFVNESYENMRDLVQYLQLDYLQFHGDESPAFCNEVSTPWFKAIRLSSEEDLQNISQYTCEYVLVDAFVAGQYGGTGKKPDWALAAQVKQSGKKILLAGGLSPENVQLAIATVQPFGVDVASGVESEPGKKDFKKMEEFISRAKHAHLRVV